MSFANGPDDGLDDRHGDAVAGLFSGLGIRRDNFVCVGEALQAEHFARRQTAFAIYQKVIIGSASAEGAGEWVRADVAGFIFVPDRGFSCGLENAPATVADVIRGVMLPIDLAFEDFAKRFHASAALRPFEVNAGPIADDENAFTLLREAEIERVENAILAIVAEVADRFENALERLTFVVADEEFYVFENERPRFLRVQNARNVEEKRAARVVEAAHVADDAEGLAGETGEQ